MITSKAARGIVFAGIVSLALVGCTNTPLNEDANASNAAAASALGVIILKEPFTLGIAIGLPMVLIGSYFASRKVVTSVQ